MSGTRDRGADLSIHLPEVVDHVGSGAIGQLVEGAVVGACGKPLSFGKVKGILPPGAKAALLGLSRIPVDEGQDVGVGAGPCRAERGRAGAVGDAPFHRPEDRLVEVVGFLHVVEWVRGGPGLRAGKEGLKTEEYLF